jgi:cobalt-zinc-cadmium efflux system protein
MIHNTVEVLMERVPHGFDYEGIKKRLGQIDGVAEVNDLHVWAITSSKLALSVHLVTIGNVHSCLLQAKKICQKYGIEHSTIETHHPTTLQATETFTY